MNCFHEGARHNINRLKLGWRIRSAYLPTAYPQSERLAENIQEVRYHKIEERKVKDKEGNVRIERKKVVRRYVLIRELDFEEMERELKFSRFIILNYMVELARLGILKKFKKSGPNKQMVYAIGYFSPYKKDEGTKFRSLPFLINTKEIRKALSDFNPYR